MKLRILFSISFLIAVLSLSAQNDTKTLLTGKWQLKQIKMNGKNLLMEGKQAVLHLSADGTALNMELRDTNKGTWELPVNENSLLKIVDEKGMIMQYEIIALNENKMILKEITTNGNDEELLVTFKRLKN